MRSNDLRIGNWVCDSKFSQFPMQVVNLGTDYVYLDFEGNECDVWEPDIKEICGIPLTEELLLKCGFEKSQIDLRCAHVPHAYVGLRFEKGEFRYYKESDKWSYRVTRIDNPIFLHQLQNLYYSLMGEELKIELNK